MQHEYRRFGVVFLAALSCLLFILTTMQDIKNFKPIAANDNTPALSEQRQQHILYGDARGGGHLHGIGKPCKSEFPAGWSANDIIDTTKLIAANDNIDWRQGDNGYYVGEQSVNGVRVRVVLDRERDDIITAYPLNTRRNPCPPAH